MKGRTGSARRKAAAADFPWPEQREAGAWWVGFEDPPPADQPSARTSLDPRPTNLQDPPLTSPVALRCPPDPEAANAFRDTWANFRHSGWAPQRARLLQGLRDALGDGPRVARFMNCGRRAVLQQSLKDPSRFRVRCDRCNDRFCIPCQRVRAHRLAGRIVASMKPHAMRFVTLTVVSREEPLAASIARLITGWTALRRRPLWERHCKGGVAFLEVTRNERTGLWHPHIHALVEGTYIPQGALSADWRSCTGDSHIVDVRRVSQPEDVVRYVVGYVTKPLGKSLPREGPALAEFIRTSRAKRFVATFGSWRGVALVREDPDNEAWADVAPVADLLAWADNRDLEAFAMVRRFEAWLFPRELERPPPLDRGPLPGPARPCSDCREDPCWCQPCDKVQLPSVDRGPLPGHATNCPVCDFPSCQCSFGDDGQRFAGST